MNGMIAVNERGEVFLLSTVANATINLSDQPETIITSLYRK